MPVYVSWAEFQTQTGVLSANQTVPPLVQSATFDHAAKSAQVSWAEFQTPSISIPSLTANQFVPAMTQVATMYDVIATISGGGTVTETLPWRVVAGAQAMPALSQSATMGTAPTVGLISANQFVPAITQAGAMDASRSLFANQTMPAISQVGAVVGTAGVGGYKGKQRIIEGPKRGIRVKLTLPEKEVVQQAQQVAEQVQVVAKKLSEGQDVAKQLDALNKKIEAMKAQHESRIATTTAQMQAQINMAAAIAENALRKVKELQDENEALLALL